MPSICVIIGIAVDRGIVIAGQVAFAKVYPVTQADNDEPLVPRLKGKRIAAAAGDQGCDAHYVCVCGHPPDAEHANRVYHACEEGRRCDGNERVVNQESQLLPEFLIKVRVRDEPALCDRVRFAAETWGQSRAEAVSNAALVSTTMAKSVGEEAGGQRPHSRFCGPFTNALQAMWGFFKWMTVSTSPREGDLQWLLAE